MFSECLQLPFCHDCFCQGQATNRIHFNLVFLVSFIKINFLLAYMHSWLEDPHLAFLSSVYLNVFPQYFLLLFLSIALNCLFVHLEAGKDPKYAEV